MEMTGAFSRKNIGFRVLWSLLQHHIHNLRNNVACPLDDDGVANANVSTFAQFFAVATDPLDVILIVQRRVLHHDAAHGYRSEARNRRQSAGSTDLDVDTFENSCRLFCSKLVCNSPAWTARNEAEAFLPVETINFVDHPVDIVVEPGALLLDLAMKGDQLLDRVA